MSWAFFYSTMWPGIFFTVSMCLLSAYGFYILGVCSEITGMQAYGEIWKMSLGKDLAWVPNLVTLTFCTLAITACLIICGDYVPLALSGLGLAWAPLQHRQFVILLVSALVGPLNFLRDNSFLGYTSIVGTAGTLYTCFVLAYETIDLPEESSDWKTFELGSGIFLMIPTVTFAFNGHFNAPDLYQQLACRSPARWMLVTVVAFGLCFVLTCVCAISGYVMFGSDLSLAGRSNVLNAPVLQAKAEVMVAYLGTTFSVAMGIPLYVHSSRDSLELLWLRCRHRNAGAPGDSILRRNIMTSLCMLFAMGIAMMVQELGLVNAIAGAVCAPLIMFVFPSMMYIKCTSPGLTSPSVQKQSFIDVVLHRGLPWLSIAIGSFTGVAGVVTSVLSSAHVEIKPR